MTTDSWVRDSTQGLTTGLGENRDAELELKSAATVRFVMVHLTSLLLCSEFQLSRQNCVCELTTAWRVLIRWLDVARLLAFSIDDFLGSYPV